MNCSKTTVGNVELTSLSDGRLQFETSEFFPSVPQDAWAQYAEDLTPTGNLVMNMGCFLVRSEGKTVLVDTGLGKDSQGLEALETGKLVEEFQRNGLSTDDVDIVVITHLHRDHVGWNLSSQNGEMRPTFSNARYFVPKADWDIFTRRAGMSVFSYIKDQVVPLQDMGVLELFEGEHALTSELTTLPTPGHTPGHTSILVASQGERAVLVGDATHIPAQAQETDWSPSADSDKVRSAETRRNLMDRIEGDNALLVSGHYPAPGYGRLVRLEGRRYWRAL